MTWPPGATRRLATSASTPGRILIAVIFSLEAKLARLRPMFFVSVSAGGAVWDGGAAWAGPPGPRSRLVKIRFWPFSATWEGVCLRSCPWRASSASDWALTDDASRAETPNAATNAEKCRRVSCLMRCDPNPSK